MLDGKGLERERKEIPEGMNSEMAWIYRGTDNDSFGMIRRIQGDIVLVRILKITQSSIRGKKVNVARIVILEIGRTEAHHDKQCKNQCPESLEIFSHVKACVM